MSATPGHSKHPTAAVQSDGSDAAENVDPHKNSEHVTNPNAGTADLTDGKEQYEWESKYPNAARKVIHTEAVYLVVCFFLSLVAILLTWKGIPGELLGVSPGPAAHTLRKYSYYASAGLLGGSVFAIKFMYRVVARGYWHLDRQLWRYLSPIVSLGVAFSMGALIEGSLLSGRPPSSGAAIIGTGFLIGYFADHAIAKLYELASVLFGTTTKSSEGKSHKE